MERSVRGEVFFDGSLIVTGGLERVTHLVCYRAGTEEAAFSSHKIFLHTRAKEAIVGSRAREVLSGEVAAYDIFLKAVDAVGDALEVFQYGDLAGYGGKGRPLREDGLRNGGPCVYWDGCGRHGWSITATECYGENLEFKNMVHVPTVAVARVLGLFRIVWLGKTCRRCRVNELRE